MSTTPDPGAVSSAYDIFAYVGSAAAAIVLGWLGYLRGRPAEPIRTTTTVAGAIVDNQALAPLIDRLDQLISVLARDVALREREVEEEAQQERVDRAVEKALERIERLMRENP